MNNEKLVKLPKEVERIDLEKATFMEDSTSNVELPMVDEKLELVSEQYNEIASNKIPALQGQLESMTNKLEKPKRCKIGVSALWSASTWDTSLVDMKSQIDLWALNEVEEISYIINIQYVNGEFVIYGNQDNSLNALLYAKEKGINTVALKVHGANQEDITAYGVEKFKIKWKQLLIDIHNKFSILGATYFIVLNEREFLYDDVSYEIFIIECLNQMKTYGYKVGVATASTYYSCIKLTDNVKASIDCFFVNQYPSLSFSGTSATIEQCKSAWNSSFLISALDNLSKYNKPIILSESGTRDYYEYLANPSNYAWDNLGVTPSKNGEVGILYLGSLLQSKYINYISSTWLWFNGTFMKEDVKKYVAQYKGGVL